MSQSSSTNERAYLIEDVLQVPLRQSAAFDVLDSSKLLRPLPALGFLDESPVRVVLQSLPVVGVLAQIHLSADEEAGDTGAVVADLGEPLVPDVVERGLGYDAEANEEYIGLGIRERPQAVVILLSGRIEQTQGIGLVADPRTQISRQQSDRGRRGGEIMKTERLR